MKNVAIIISGAPEGDNLRDLTIETGATAGDILRALNLHNYLLSREGSGQHFAEAEEIYAVIDEGSKLRATPVAEVGIGWLTTFLTWLSGGATKTRGTAVTTIKSSSTMATVTAKKTGGRSSATRSLLSKGTSSIRVEADQRPLWEIRGWQHKGDKLVGAFRTPWKSFAGEISLDARKPSFLIIDPPDEVLKGPHSACFRPRGNDRFHIHFGVNVRPDNVDAGIAAVERLIIQSISPKQRRPR